MLFRGAICFSGGLYAVQEGYMDVQVDSSWFQVGFSWFQVGFHGFSWFQANSFWFQVGFHGFLWFKVDSHGFWLVSMVFQVSLVVSWFFMVFGWFPWFFK